MTTKNEQLPHWDLTNVYPGLDSVEFKEGMEELKAKVEDLEKYVEEKQISRSNVPSAEVEASELGAMAAGAIDRINAINLLAGTLRAYIASFTSTDSYDTEAMKLMSQLQQQFVPLQQVRVQIDGWIGVLGERLAEVIASDETAKAHSFYLEETAEQSKYMMSDAEEGLAAELALSGAQAWGKLQGTVTSQLKVDFEMDGEVKTLPIPALQNVRRYNPDEGVRKRAFEAEIEAWVSVREPLAACMNGVKGAVNVLNKRRGREDAVHPSIDMARIDRATLEAMMGAMKDAFPTFRKYLKAKAKRFGKDSLPWWDLFAPTGKTERSFSWEDTQAFILEHFGGFSDHLASLTKRAFDNNWIDAEPRDGKRGGAFCMGVPAVEESRILCNFDGTMNQLSTVAHELGHAYHNYCMVGKTRLQRQTPMTMAETASIFCQTIITDAALEQATSDDEKLTILETSLIGSTQVIVDITSRFIFEKEVFERREEAELSADDFCEMMTRAQKETYGEGLDEEHLHPYMWAWKPHYYRAGLSFYNYPYAFGLLFGTGLYAIYQERGADFIPEYQELLGSTGLGSAADLAAGFDIDLRSTDFWEGSLKVIGKQIEQYIAL